MQLKFNYQKVEKFNIKQNGIQIIENDNYIEIYNDVFRTVPLFITKDKNGELIIFSNFEDFYEFDNDRTIDEAGFWEIILFASGIWTRTLYKNIKQMPSASKIIIDKRTNEYKIERYWDFNIQEDKSIDSIEKAAQGLYDRLDTIFSKLDRTQKYVMGMSGGMDSRITLAFLSKYIPKENLELFTYGFDERLLEYKYACEVAEALGYNKPKFHKLTKDSYKNALKYLPKQSGGQIGINHCHIIDYLKNNNLEERKIITTSYSEIIFSLLVQCNNENSSFISKDLELSSEILETINNDKKKIFNNFIKTEFFTSFSDFKYQTEKHPKFHEMLSYIISSNNKQENPYTNYELLTYVMSISYKYKCKKKLQDYILNNYFNIKIDNISSSRFEWGKAGNKFYDWYYFKISNRINAILRPLTKGKIQLFNKYQTEEQERILYRDLDINLKNATSKFVKLGLMSEEQKKEWDKFPLKSSGISERYNLISLGELI